jgi:hypothetical protein
MVLTFSPSRGADTTSWRYKHQARDKFASQLERKLTLNLVVVGRDVKVQIRLCPA